MNQVVSLLQLIITKYCVVNTRHFDTLRDEKVLPRQDKTLVAEGTCNTSSVAYRTTDGCCVLFVRFLDLPAFMAYMFARNSLIRWG